MALNIDWSRGTPRIRDYNIPELKGYQYIDDALEAYKSGRDRRERIAKEEAAEKAAAEKAARDRSSWDEFAGMLGTEDIDERIKEIDEEIRQLEADNAKLMGGSINTMGLDMPLGTARE